MLWCGCMFSKSIWRLSLHTESITLWLPLPLFVLTDLLRAAEDLCEVILPRLGLPNYAAQLREVLQAIAAALGDEPLVEIQTRQAHISCRRIQ